MQEYYIRLLKNLAADERTINTFGQHYLNGAGVRPQTPVDAPPLAGFNLKSLVALLNTSCGESVEELSAVSEPFIEAFVMEKSQKILISAYRNAMEDKIGSDIEVSWKKKTGESVKTKVIIVPISYMGELLALHFISKI